MSKGIFVRIRDEKTWNEFRDFVLQKHGKLHTALGEELIEAIKTYLKNQDTHTQLSGKALKEAEVLKKEILKYVNPGGSLPQNMLESMVRRVKVKFTGWLEMRQASLDEYMEKKEFICDRCGRKFKSAKALNIHISKIHSGDMLPPL